MAENLLAAMGPMPDITGAFQNGIINQTNIAGAQLNQQTAAFDLQKAQQEAAQQQAAQQAWSQDVGAFIQNPTAEGAANLALKHPDQAQAIQAAWKTRDGAVQAADMQGLSQIYYSIEANKPELAQQYLEQRQAADAAAGKHEPMVDALAQAFKTDPQIAKGMAAYLLASGPNGDNFVKTLDKGGDGSVVVNEGGALVRKSDGTVLYQAGKSPHYMTVKNADGTESIVAVPEGGAAPVVGGGTPGQRYTGGWTPRASNGGDNSDTVVNNKIAGAAKFLGVAPTADISGISPLKIAQAMTLSEGGAGSLADRNNNPGNLRNPDGSYKIFPTKQAGLNAAAALVARKLKSGQTTVQSLIEGLPVGGSKAASPAGATAVYTSKGGDQSAFGLDPSLTGDAAMAALPVQVRNRVQQLIDGRSILTAREKGTPLGQQLMAAANQVDPTYSEATAQARFHAVNDFSGAGKAAARLAAADRLALHAADLWNLSQDLSGPDAGWAPLSNALTSAGQAFQQKTVGAYKTILPLISGELQNLTKIGAATVDESKHIMDSLRPDQPTDTRNAAIQEVVRLGMAQQPAARASWESAFQGAYRPKMPRDFSPQTNAIFQNVLDGKGKLVPIHSPADLAKLPKGTRVLTPDGRIGVTR